MTRKRFIKLLMTARFQRNEANNMADMALLIYGSYKVAWDKKYKHIVAVRTAIICMRNSMRDLLEALHDGAAYLNAWAYGLRSRGLASDFRQSQVQNDSHQEYDAFNSES